MPFGRRKTNWDEIKKTKPDADLLIFLSLYQTVQAKNS